MLVIWLNTTDDITALLEKYSNFIQSHSYRYNYGDSPKTNKTLFGHERLSGYNKVLTIIPKGNVDRITGFLRRKIAGDTKYLIEFYIPNLLTVPPTHCLRSINSQQITISAEVSNENN